MTMRCAIGIDVGGTKTAAGLVSLVDASVLALLTAIHKRVSALESRPFKGTTDALTALRLGEASCNGRSRLFVALARRAHVPARLVGGIILENGTKRVGHQWVEAWVAGRWVPFCPTNGWFAEIPAHYLTLYHGDRAAFSRTCSAPPTTKSPVEAAEFRP